MRRPLPTGIALGIALGSLIAGTQVAPMSACDMVRSYRAEFRSDAPRQDTVLVGPDDQVDCEDVQTGGVYEFDRCWCAA